MIVSRNLHNMYAVPAYRIQGNERKKNNNNKTIDTMKAKQLKKFLIVNKSMKSKQLKNSQLGLATA